MFFSPRIRLKPLASLCHRLAIATGAGLEDRRIWRDEAQRSSGSQRAMATHVSDCLARGQSIAEALAGSGDFLPPLFKQVVAVGETSGQLDRTYRRLAEHYEHALAAKRSLASAVAWPAIQLGLAALVVGLVTWVTDALGLKDIDGKPIDLFGFGLVGSRGLAIYVGMLVALVGFIVFVLAAARRGAAGTRTLQQQALRIPVVGGAVETIAMAQFTWALQLVFDTPMDLRKALPLALEATGNDAYARLGPQVAQRIGQGATIHAALAETGAIPQDLLNAIDVGEQSGMLAETMQRQSREYQERAAVAVKVLGQALGYAVWLAVMALLIMLIFRVFSFYTGTIQSLTKPGVI
jgi:type II secretory pathway component PulF